MLLFNCEVSLTLTWSENCVLTSRTTRDAVAAQGGNGAYVIILDEYAVVGTHWIALYEKIMNLFTFIALVLSMFLKKLKDLLGKKASKQTYLEYKQIIQ